MPEGNILLGNALGTGGAHVILPHDFQHGGAGQTDKTSVDTQTQHNDGHDHMAEPAAKITGDGHIAGTGQDPQFEGKHQHSHHAQPEHGHRNADVGKEGDHTVNGLAAVLGSNDAEQDTGDRTNDKGGDHHGQGCSQTGQDDVSDLRLIADGLALGAPEQAAEQPDPDSVFSKLPPEQQQEMTDSVKAMLQTLIDADLKSTGEVSQETKEAAQAQGFTIAGDGTLEQAEAPQEAAYRLESSDYLYIQTSETGYDYTLYGPDYKELDGGQLDNPDLSLAEAGKEILAIHERPAGTMEPLTGDGLDDFLEATEQANAIPQPQAWNGIDGLLNGKPFIPEASPADRAAALIELAEKNAPRLGSEERQLIVAYAESVGDTDKVIGLINRLCEQGYELQKGQMDSFVKSEIESEIAVANAQRQIAQNPAAEPVVTILWSESPHLKDGQQMPLHEAEAVFKELDSARRHDREQPGYMGHWYDKTKFRIDFTMQGQPDSYEGRQDFGDGDGSLIQHIRGYHEYYAQDESWKNHVLHHEGPEAWEADKAQRDMLLHEFIPYMELHCNLAAMEQEARRPLRSGETLTPEQTAYFNAVLDYVKECRPLLNQGQYHLPEPPQLADFDQSLQDYKKQIEAERNRRPPLPG